MWRLRLAASVFTLFSQVVKGSLGMDPKLRLGGLCLDAEDTDSAGVRVSISKDIERLGRALLMIDETYQRDTLQANDSLRFLHLHHELAVHRD